MALGGEGVSVHPVIAASRAGVLPHGALEAAVEVPPVVAVAPEVEVVVAVAND